MPDWSEILREINTNSTTHGTPFDQARRTYLKRLSDITKRNTIVYYSGWHQKGHLAPAGGVNFSINDADKSGFMTAIHKMDRSLGLDLLLHTPGGDVAATESLVDYLRQMFTNIRAIIPQIAMSAGTMIALACNEIVMGKQSSLGPIDPQFGGIPAHGVIEEFNQAKKDITSNPVLANLWIPILQKYQPTFIGECQKAIDWGNSIANQWLNSWMLADDTEREAKSKAIVDELSDHSLTLSHARHISLKKARDLGLRIVELEANDELQDAVLSVHHACIHTLASTNAFKIIENQLGHAYISTVSQIAIPRP